MVKLVPHTQAATANTAISKCALQDVRDKGRLQRLGSTSPSQARSACSALREKGKDVAGVLYLQQQRLHVPALPAFPVQGHLNSGAASHLLLQTAPHQPMPLMQQKAPHCEWACLLVLCWLHWQLRLACSVLLPQKTGVASLPIWCPPSDPGQRQTLHGETSDSPWPRQTVSTVTHHPLWCM